MKKIKFDPENFKDVDKIWLRHKHCREWYYATGILFDKDKNMYTYQYTLLTLSFGLLDLNVPMIALTDIKNNKHYYLQAPEIGNESIVINENEASFKGVAECKKAYGYFLMKLKHKDFQLSVRAFPTKKPVWQCDNGLLKMGENKKKEITYYCSYTNMKTEATLILNGETIQLEGQTWFDRQGGTYDMIKGKHHWEWFSLRFFTGEEVMLFNFPRTLYKDGTYIDEQGNYTRLDEYNITPLKQIWVNDLKWNSSWLVYVNQKDVNIKERDFSIEPIQDGHINFAYFEEVCYIKNIKGEVIGYAFAELLPGVLNLKYHNSSKLFKRIELPTKN